LLRVTSARLEAAFDAERGMFGASLRCDGQDLLAPEGMPLMAPWANRLGSRRYEFAGLAVDLDGIALHTDVNGLPIHGTMRAQPWEVTHHDADSLHARFDFGARPDLLESFPFPHELRIEIDVREATLTHTSTLTPTTDRAVPVAFGSHPYFQVARDAVSLRLPARERFELDARLLPTGPRTPQSAEDELVGTRAFDDCYELMDDRVLALTEAGRRLTVALDRGYSYLQVYAPPAADFVCLEPMTAPINALVDGTCALVAPGGQYSAQFTVGVEDL
jgi:aldose 1-epimerase